MIEKKTSQVCHNPVTAGPGVAQASLQDDHNQWDLCLSSESYIKVGEHSFSYTEDLLNPTVWARPGPVSEGLGNLSHLGSFRGGRRLLLLPWSRS